MTNAWVVSSSEARRRVIVRPRTAAEDEGSAPSVMRLTDFGATGERQTW